MKRGDILNEAKRCVLGQREQDYGTPENNFQLIADLWSAYFNHKFSALDISMAMTLMKLARIRTGTATEDSFVDAAGYIACGGEIADKTPDPESSFEKFVDSVKDSNPPIYDPSGMINGFNRVNTKE